jgi:hypothetical protein
MKPKLILYCALLVGAIGLVGCRSASLVESFYTKNGMMYFIPSVVFKSLEGEAELDFTYHESDSLQVVCNFTIESSLPHIYALQRAEFQVGGSVSKLDSLKLMFVMRSENKARYTSMMTKEQFRSLFSHSLAYFIVQGKSSSLVLEADGSFKKNAKAVRQDVLNLP